MGNLPEVQIRNVKGVEKEEFLNLQKNLGLSDESCFYSFCASISFQRLVKNPKIKFTPLDNGKNAFHASSIPDIKIFESLLDIYYPDSRMDQKDLFENMFYSGFLEIKKWWTDVGQNEETELEKIAGLMSYIKNKDK